MSAAADTFSRRQVLHASLGIIVASQAFTDTDHERSRIVREVLDLFLLDVPQTPAPERTVDMSESVVLDGNVIVNSMRTNGHLVRQRRTLDFEALPELSIAEPFATIPDNSLRGAASEALAAINNRKPSARRTPRTPAPKPPKATAPVWVATAIVIGGLAIAVLVAVAKGSI